MLTVPQHFIVLPHAHLWKLIRLPGGTNYNFFALEFSQLPN